jgi:hypothetical protein
LGFLGITADVTGFSFDNSVLMIAVGVAAFLQILKNDVDSRKEEEKKLKN